MNCTFPWLIGSMIIYANSIIITGLLKYIIRLWSFIIHYVYIYIHTYIYIYIYIYICISLQPGQLLWWSYLHMTSSNGNILRATGHLCGEFNGHRRGALIFSAPFVLEKYNICDICTVKSPAFATTSLLYITPTDCTSIQDLLMQEHKQKLYKTCPCCRMDTWHIESKQILQPPEYLIIIVNRITYSNNRITKN